jgi:hypothetical protein
LTISFSEHQAFAREIKAIQKKLKTGVGLESVKKLLAAHFDTEDPKQAIAPGKLHHIKTSDIWSLWKVEVFATGLKPNQWPRVWFLRSGSAITFLVCASHTQNYDDNEMERLALDRLSDYVG